MGPPNSLPPSYTTDNDRVSIALNVRIMHLNKLGMMGREFVTAENVREGVTYLMCRRR